VSESSADGKALRLRKTFHLEEMQGRRLCTIQKRVLHIRDTMEIEGPEGDRMALVHEALISPLRERWKIDVEDGPDLQARGNIVDHEYDIEADGGKVAHMSKRWFACGTPTASRWQPTRTRRRCSPSR
jgi:uncharacterized protein YxjI